MTPAIYEKKCEFGRILPGSYKNQFPTRLIHYTEILMLTIENQR